MCCVSSFSSNCSTCTTWKRRSPPATPGLRTCCALLTLSLNGCTASLAWVRGLPRSFWSRSEWRSSAFRPPAMFRRVSARRGKKRAIVAVGHSILVTAYYLLTRGAMYQDLGETYFDERDRQNVVRRSIRRLQGLGYTVHLESTDTKAA